MRRLVSALRLACALLAANAASAEALDEAPWLRIELRQDASEFDALRLDPERERQILAENEGFVDLLIRFQVRQRGDGIEETTITQVRRFLSDAGAEEGGDLELRVMPSHMKAVIERAYVLLPDGTRLGLDRHAIQIQPDVVPRVFSNVRRVILPLPGLTPGATAVLVYRSSFRTRDWPFPISSHFTLRSFHPVERLELDHSWDAGVTAPRWASTDPDLVCREADRSLRCTRERISAASVDPDLKSFYDETPELVVAAPTTWSHVAALGRHVVESKISEGLPPGAVARILAGTTTAEQRWQRIFDFAANEVRYLGLEHGTGAVVPRAPAETLERRYGDCKDKVSLMIALARAAGIDAHAALTSTERFDPSRLQMPSASYFNHMIACRTGSDGSRECVDPTMSSVAPDESTAALGGAVLLPLRDQTQEIDRLERRQFASEVEIEQRTVVACNGSREETITRRLRGLTGIVYRQGLAAVTPPERTRALGDEFRQVVSSSVSPSFDITGLREPHRALEISTKISTPPSSPLADGSDIQDSDVWTLFHGAGLRSGNHHFAFLNPGVRIRSTLRYDTCDQLVPRFLGAHLDLSSRYGHYRRSYATEGSAVIVNSTFEAPSGRIPASEIPAFNQFLETALDQSGVWFRMADD